MLLCRQRFMMVEAYICVFIFFIATREFVYDSYPQITGEVLILYFATWNILVIKLPWFFFCALRDFALAKF